MKHAAAPEKETWFERGLREESWARHLEKLDFTVSRVPWTLAPPTPEAPYYKLSPERDR